MNDTTYFLFYANQTVYYSLADDMSNGVNLFYTPVLVILGLFGNSMSMYIFYATKLRTQSTSHYLSALAITDMVFILQLLPPWLNAMEISGIFHYPVLCQAFVYTSYFSCSLSSWLVVAFTVERFVAVLYPLKRTMVCTVSRARFVISTLAILAAVINLPVLRYAKPINKDCNIDVEYIVDAALFNVIDTVFSFTIPLFMIIILNTWIVVGVYRIEKTRRKLMKSNRGRISNRMRMLPMSQHRVTRMLLIVSTVFVVFNMPAYTMRILAYAYDLDQPEYSGTVGVLQQIALMFFNTNFAINFLLYCLSGQNFRYELMSKIPCLKTRRQRAVTISETISTRPARASSLSTSYGSAAPEMNHNVEHVVASTSASVHACCSTGDVDCCSSADVDCCSSADVDCITADAGSTPVPRRNQIIRPTVWKFDNSRQYMEMMERFRKLHCNNEEQEGQEMTMFNVKSYD